MVLGALAVTGDRQYDTGVQQMAASPALLVAAQLVMAALLAVLVLVLAAPVKTSESVATGVVSQFASFHKLLAAVVLQVRVAAWVDWLLNAITTAAVKPRVTVRRNGLDLRLNFMDFVLRLRIEQAGVSGIQGLLSTMRVD